MKLKSIRKEIMAEITEEQPHYNTLSTIVRRRVLHRTMLLETPPILSYRKFRRYRKRFMNIDNYFNSSYKNMVSHFAKEEKISAAELRNLAMIENKS
jgi:predicted transcriptional regulator